MMTPRQRLELLSMVTEDLEFIRQFSSPTASDDKIRRISVDLHKLLIEDVLAKCWREVGGEKSLRVNAVDSILSGSQNGLSLTLGAQINSMRILGFSFRNGPSPDKDFERKHLELYKGMQRHRYGEIPRSNWKLKVYLERPGAQHNGTTIPRRDIIQYMAVKRGGKHWDIKRRNSDKSYIALDIIDDTPVTFCPIGFDEERLIGGKAPITAMVMSYAQDIIDSPDVIELERRCRIELSAAR